MLPRPASYHYPSLLTITGKFDQYPVISIPSHPSTKSGLQLLFSLAGTMVKGGRLANLEEQEAGHSGSPANAAEQEGWHIHSSSLKVRGIISVFSL
jgi:hypothetical protein